MEVGFDFERRTPYTRWLAEIDARLGKPDHWDLVVTVWYPSMGKTERTFFVARENAKLGNKVAYLSLELTRESLIQRTARKKAGVNYQDFQNWMYTDKQKEIMVERYKKLDTFPNLKIDWVEASPSIEELERIIEEYHDRGYNMVFIDNLGKIDNCATDIEKQSRATSRLQDIKNKWNMCIVLLHHLKKPWKSDIMHPWGGSAFSGSQKIKDNCSIMLEVWRDLDPYLKSWDVTRKEVHIVQYKQTWDWITGTQIIYFDDWTYKWQL